MIKCIKSVIYSHHFSYVTCQRNHAKEDEEGKISSKPEIKLVLENFYILQKINRCMWQVMLMNKEEIKTNCLFVYIFIILKCYEKVFLYILWNGHQWIAKTRDIFSHNFCVQSWPQQTSFSINFWNISCTNNLVFCNVKEM